ncbi:DUF4178 domain-containing protein [Flammeovirgaceae bacterium SG7u.111]|nr:DUF4178 domain-containing protein [Flammeovirgaceae bacterium SG7u.132]WPO34188.1 DUF4178 domain-containing protein [Flammeovirgaceae bacterium SG7u.111]
MNSLQVRYTIRKNFPIAVQDDISKLPAEGQEEFLYRYSREMRSVGLSYMFHFIVGTSYLYQGKWVKQLLFWLTGLGFGIGWVINLFRMPSMIKKVNHKIAKRIVSELYKRYRIYPEDSLDFLKKRKLAAQGQSEMKSKAKPRNIKPTYDPTDLTVGNLQTGFLLDYDLKTWEVVNENQFDWYNGQSESEYKITADTRQKFLNVRIENGQEVVIDFKIISIYAINNRLEAEITLRNKPANILTFNEMPFYREGMTKEGIFFNITTKDHGKKIDVWEYFNEARTEVLRIERHGKDFRTFYGNVVSTLQFSDILPKKVMS